MNKDRFDFLLTESDSIYLEGCFQLYGGYPSLQQLYKLMDDTWREIGCDEDLSESNLSAFYSHPVWLLNGIFIEQDQTSLNNRKIFLDYIVDESPVRVGDIGGGFGTLARMIGKACPHTQIEVIEPHPHPEAIRRANELSNVNYCPELSGQYDLLIATDVFEHVPDPITLVQATASHLKPNGKYLIANCFYPVILCHLPQTFHFRYSWNVVLAALGLKPGKQVAYGWEFTQQEEGSIERARFVENQSQKIFPWIQSLPIGRGKVRLGRILFRFFASIL